MLEGEGESEINFFLKDDGVVDGRDFQGRALIRGPGYLRVLRVYTSIRYKALRFGQITAVDYHYYFFFVILRNAFSLF